MGAASSVLTRHAEYVGASLGNEEQKAILNLCLILNTANPEEVEWFGQDVEELDVDFNVTPLKSAEHAEKALIGDNQLAKFDIVAINDFSETKLTKNHVSELYQNLRTHAKQTISKDALFILTAYSSYHSGCSNFHYEDYGKVRDLTLFSNSFADSIRFSKQAYEELRKRHNRLQIPLQK